jgi:hypothetical protein
VLIVNISNAVCLMFLAAKPLLKQITTVASKTNNTINPRFKPSPTGKVAFLLAKMTDEA